MERPEEVPEALEGGPPVHRVVRAEAGVEGGRELTETQVLRVTQAQEEIPEAPGLLQQL